MNNTNLGKLQTLLSMKFSGFKKEEKKMNLDGPELLQKCDYHIKKLNKIFLIFSLQSF